MAIAIIMVIAITMPSIDSAQPLLGHSWNGGGCCGHGSSDAMILRNKFPAENNIQPLPSSLTPDPLAPDAEAGVWERGSRWLMVQCSVSAEKPTD